MQGATMQPVLLNSGVPDATATQCDSITLELHAPTAPYGTLYSTQTVLKTTGAATALFPKAAADSSYYVVVKGRNLLETWSANPVAFTTSATYHFGAPSQAYGGNLGMVGGIPVIYKGDIDDSAFGDGTIDNIDFGVWIVDAINFAEGYYRSDLNGDGVSDNIDFNFWLTNAINFVEVLKP
jgi:hypothetical protein